MTWAELAGAGTGSVVTVVLRGRDVRFTKDSRGRWLSAISGAEASHGKLARWRAVAVVPTEGLDAA
jgi:hypothetical protein